MDDKLAKKRLSLQKIINKMHAEEVFVVKSGNFFKDQSGTIVKIQEFNKETKEVLTTDGKQIFITHLSPIKLSDVFFERHGFVQGYLTARTGDRLSRDVYIAAVKRDDCFYNVYCDLFVINIRNVHEFQNLINLYDINLVINPYETI